MSAGSYCADLFTDGAVETHVFNGVPFALAADASGNNAWLAPSPGSITLPRHSSR